MDILNPKSATESPAPAEKHHLWDHHRGTRLLAQGLTQSSSPLLYMEEFSDRKDQMFVVGFLN